jgi:hypothetical protein
VRPRGRWSSAVSPRILRLIDPGRIYAEPRRPSVIAPFRRIGLAARLGRPARRSSPGTRYASARRSDRALPRAPFHTVSDVHRRRYRDDQMLRPPTGSDAQRMSASSTSGWLFRASMRRRRSAYRPGVFKGGFGGGPGGIAVAMSMLSRPPTPPASCR